MLEKWTSSLLHLEFPRSVREHAAPVPGRVATIRALQNNLLCSQDSAKLASTLRRQKINNKKYYIMELKSFLVYFLTTGNKFRPQIIRVLVSITHHFLNDFDLLSKLGRHFWTLGLGVSRGRPRKRLVLLHRKIRSLFF